MALAKYFARRSLTLGTTLGTQVTLYLPTKYAGLVPQRSSMVSTRKSMAGLRESYYYRGEVSYQIGFIPVSSAIADQIRMFLDSVEDGQVFSFAPAGVLSTPSPAYRNAVVDPPQYSSGPHPDQQIMTQFSAITIVEVP